MTTKEFLTKLLESQNLSPEQAADIESHRDEVTTYLRKKFGADPLIRYAGSLAKGTMIKDKYDLDIVCYFPHTDDRNLKDIRGDVSDHLAAEYIVKSKSSAERILDLKGSNSPQDFHIDVVPGRRIEGSSNVFLHVASEDKERIMTNLKIHIDEIKNSGCVPIIRLVKLWAHRNNLQIRTFVLELFVIKVLKGSSAKNDLEKSLLKVIEAFRDDFSSTRLEDPANTNNIVSTLVTSTDKASLSSCAKSTLDLINGSDSERNWHQIFNEPFVDEIKNNNNAVAYTPGVAFKPSKPWSN